MVTAVVASPVENIIKLGDEYIALKSRFYPVWATSMGLHDYDSLLTDYSVDSVFNYKNKISVIKQKSNEQGLFEEYDFDLWDSLILC